MEDDLEELRMSLSVTAKRQQNTTHKVGSDAELTSAIADYVKGDTFALTGILLKEVMSGLGVALTKFIDRLPPGALIAEMSYGEALDADLGATLGADWSNRDPAEQIEYYARAAPVFNYEGFGWGKVTSACIPRADRRPKKKDRFASTYPKTFQKVEDRPDD